EYLSPLVLDRRDETKGRLESAVPASNPGVHGSLLISWSPRLDTARGAGVPLRAVSQRTPPLAGFTGEGRMLRAGSIPRVVRQESRIDVDFALWDRPTVIVALDRLHAPGIRVVVVPAGAPVALLRRLATHLIEPALRLASSL